MVGQQHVALVTQEDGTQQQVITNSSKDSKLLYAVWLQVGDTFVFDG